MSPRVQVFLRHCPTACTLVAFHHYEGLRDRLDRQEKGWVELDGVYANEKVLFRLEDVAEVHQVTAESAAAEEAERAAERFESER